MYQDRQDAVQQIACLGTPLFAFPPIASALIIQVPIYPRPVIRLGEDCPFVSCNRHPSYSEAYRPWRGVARSRLRTEDSKMSESLVSAIGNGLGEPGGRFGFMLSRRAFAEKKVLRCAVFPPVCAWLICIGKAASRSAFAGGCFWSLLRDLRLEERQVNRKAWYQRKGAICGTGLQRLGCQRSGQNASSRKTPGGYGLGSRKAGFSRRLPLQAPSEARLLGRPRRRGKCGKAS